ncbi:hypothetical protein ASG11_14540 [Sphingomonas sp. Leaf357]|uniref:hypothetical protein n=1 Tax=Sphingomonas sp. Leaf357 TaxID=1736350 RepID=UPI0006FE1058|nr:hypothetical protein [Sphingomonas sp. Leaf357]KQS02019.1 hypothetical protein ASG11_14540 [Sphingomonas sp. Leaf357]
MSHDRKPGRVRVLKTGADVQRRRRHDGPAVIIDVATAAAARKSTRGGWMMLVILFQLAAIGCAVATELFLPA